MRVLLVAASLLTVSLVGLALTPGATAAGDCIGKPEQVQVCQNLTQPAINHCVSVAVGLQGASVCTGIDGPQVCTSIEGHTCVPGSV